MSRYKAEPGLGGPQAQAARLPSSSPGRTDVEAHAIGHPHTLQGTVLRGYFRASVWDEANHAAVVVVFDDALLFALATAREAFHELP